MGTDGLVLKYQGINNHSAEYIPMHFQLSKNSVIDDKTIVAIYIKKAWQTSHHQPGIFTSVERKGSCKWPVPWSFSIVLELWTVWYCELQWSGGCDVDNIGWQSYLLGLLWCWLCHCGIKGNGARGTISVIISCFQFKFYKKCFLVILFLATKPLWFFAHDITAYLSNVQNVVMITLRW